MIDREEEDTVAKDQEADKEAEFPDSHLTTEPLTPLPSKIQKRLEHVAPFSAAEADTADQKAIRNITLSAAPPFHSTSSSDARPDQSANTQEHLVSHQERYYTAPSETVCTTASINHPNNFDPLPERLDFVTLETLM
ncbi:uncharacterized protein UBRO_20051 [Ustilago bromivora]|uniref:Uncharacterized protein n=1 Tax=Ustilago bromivora TaxID=307758 RepID=A0A1K0GVE3_9BASI|nr:uncharacterized protein UBRO_20051 [Ustilago bromivora]